MADLADATLTITAASEEASAPAAAAQPEVPVAVGMDNPYLDMGPWHAYASAEHGGRVFWRHTETGERSWTQPLPLTTPVHDELAASASRERLMALPEFAAIGVDFEEICEVCTRPFGSEMVSFKTISGAEPALEDVLRAMAQIAPEFARYPASFPSRAGLARIIFCSRLHYDGQRRGHVPSFHSSTMYIDCQPQPRRRLVSSFHHELWHFADYMMLGRDYEFADAEWHALNPSGFSYEKGGAIMRSEDATSGYMGSAKCDAFLNRYSTASAAEDKAEVWAALLTDMHLLDSSVTLGRKREMLKIRAATLLEAMQQPELWEGVRRAQLIARGEENDWEQFTLESGRHWYFNRVTHEKRWDMPGADPPPPAPAPVSSTHPSSQTSSSHEVELTRRAPAKKAGKSSGVVATHVGTRELQPVTVEEEELERLERHDSGYASEAAPVAKRPRLLSCFAACFPCLSGPQVEHAGDADV